MGKANRLIVAAALCLTLALTAAAAVTKASGSTPAVQTATWDEIIAETAADVRAGTPSPGGTGDTFDYAAVLTRHVVTGTSPSVKFTEEDFTAADATPSLKVKDWSKEGLDLLGNAYGPRMAGSNTEIRVNRVENVAFKLTMKQNAKVTVGHAALSGLAASDKAIMVRVYKRAAENLFRLNETALYTGSETTEIDAFGGEYMLEAGDSLYYEIGCTGAYEKSLTGTKLPRFTFTADPAGYTPTESYAFPALAAGVGAEGGGAVTASGDVTYSIRYGSLASPKTFAFANNALQSAEKNSAGYAAVYAGGDAFQIRTRPAAEAAQNLSLIVSMTVASDVRLAVNYPLWPNATNETLVTALRYFQQRTIGGALYRIDLGTRGIAQTSLAEEGAEDVFFVKGGDTFCMTLDNPKEMTNFYVPFSFTFDFAAYTADAAVEEKFEAAKALDDYKAQKLEILDAAFAALDEAAYSERSYASLTALKQTAAADIQAAAAASDVDLALTGYQTAAADILTVEGHRSALAAARQEIDTAYAAIDLSLYSQQNQTALAACKTDAYAALEAAEEMQSAVDAVVDAFHAAVAAVEKTVLQASLTTLIEKAVAAGGNSAGGGPLYDFFMGYGSYRDFTAFDKVQSDSLQTSAANAAGYAKVYAGFKSNKLIRVDSKNGFNYVLELTAAKDLELRVESPATAAPTNGSATFAFYRSATVDEETLFVKAYTFQAVSGTAVAEGELTAEFHMRAGEKMLLEIATTNYASNVWLMPVFTLDGESFDPAEAIDFAAVKQWNDYLKTAQATLKTRFDAIAETDYTAYDLAAIGSLYEDCAAMLAAAQNETQAQAALSAFDTGLRGFVTLAGLAALRETYRQDLAAVFGEYAADNYTEADYAALRAIYDAALAALDTAETERAMQVIVSAAGADLAAVPYLVETTKKGCGKGAAGAVMLSLGLLAVLAIKRR